MKTSHGIYFLASFFAVLVLSSCQTTKNIEKEDIKKTENIKNYKLIKIKEKSEKLSSDITYPEFSGFDLLNTFVGNTVLNQYKSFKNYNEKEWVELKKERETLGDKNYPPFEYNVESKVFETKRFESVLLQIWTYTGGAHGNSNLISFTYDKEQKKIVSIIDATGLTYKQLSQICKTEIISRFEKNEGSPLAKEILDWINEGTFPTPDNYEIFTMDKDGVTVYFETYKVAPYAYGQQEVFIPLK